MFISKIVSGLRTKQILSVQYTVMHPKNFLKIQKEAKAIVSPFHKHCQSPELFFSPVLNNFWACSRFKQDDFENKIKNIRRSTNLKILYEQYLSI
jgi:hypothetical protein